MIVLEWLLVLPALFAQTYIYYRITGGGNVADNFLRMIAAVAFALVVMIVLASFVADKAHPVELTSGGKILMGLYNLFVKLPLVAVTAYLAYRTVSASFVVDQHETIKFLISLTPWVIEIMFVAPIIGKLEK